MSDKIERIKVTIIGNGGVGEQFAKTIARNEKLELVEIYARDQEAGEKLAQELNCSYSNNLSKLKHAYIYLVAVTDRMIGTVTSQMVVPSESVVAHTAGGVEVDQICNQIKNRAALYPLQTFTRGRDVDLSHIPMLVEGNNKLSFNTISELASAISDRVVSASEKQRLEVHIAAVFACNFVNHMYAVGEDLIKRSGLDFNALKPLIRETSEKAIASESPYGVQTGPAIRNDFITKSKHCDMLASNSILKTTYINLSNSIWETSKKK